MAARGGQAGQGLAAVEGRRRDVTVGDRDVKAGCRGRLSPNGEGSRAVVRKIERDANRFKQIVRGKIKTDLRKYITHGEMIGKKGGRSRLDPAAADRHPRVPLRHQERAAASARGRATSAPRSAAPASRRRAGQAGDQPGAHILEVELTLEELAADPRRGAGPAPHRAQGQSNIIEEKDKYTGIRQAGPREPAPLQAHLQEGPQAADRLEHLRPRRPAGHPDPRGQAVPLLEADRRCRSSNAVVIYMMDVSGSMTDDQKEIVRIEAFWIDTWLKSQYDGVDDPLHHPRRRGPGGGRAHLLPHPRERRHADQLGLQPGQQDHRRRASRRSTGTSTPSTSPTATTGARTTASASACSATSCCPSEPVRLRPGREPVRLRRVLSANWRKRSTTCRTWRCPRSATRTGSTTRSRSSLAGDGDRSGRSRDDDDDFDQGAAEMPAISA